MRRPLISLQDLRRRIYAKAKSEPSWRFWGLFVHVCKRQTLHEAYRLAKANGGAPGVDGVTFAAIEAGGVEAFVEELRAELVTRKYVPLPNRKVEIPKDNGKVRVLGIPSIRDRVVQGALRLILEPIFEADFQPGSFGYRPKGRAEDAVEQVRRAISEGKTRVIDLDLKSYFDNVRHDILRKKVAARVRDRDVMWLLQRILKATGSVGVPQGGVISPLLSNIYLTEVDRMLERAREVTRRGRWTRVQYARFADDLVVLVDGRPRYGRLFSQVNRRLREELAVLEVEVNEEKTKSVDLMKRESFNFLGFQIRRARGRNGTWFPLCRPLLKKRTELLRKLKGIFRAHRSQPVGRVIDQINPLLKGWVEYFGRFHASQTLSYVKTWVEKKVRRHLARNSKRHGFGWKRWSTPRLYSTFGLFKEYEVGWRRRQKALPV